MSVGRSIKDYSFLNMRMRINVEMNDPRLDANAEFFCLLLTIHNHIFLTGMALMRNPSRIILHICYFNQTPVQSFCVQRKMSNLYISIKDWFQQLVSF